MGSTFVVGDNMVPQMANWQAYEDRESKDCSFTSSSISDFKDEIDECMYNMLEGGVSQANYEYQKLPSLLEKPLLSNALASLNSPITKDNYLVKHEEAHSSMTKDIFFFSPIGPKTSKYPSGFHHDGKAITSLAPNSLINLKQPYDQTLHKDDAQVPLKSERTLPFDASDESSPSLFVPVSVSDNMCSQFFLDQFEARHTREVHDVQCPTQPSIEALKTTPSEIYMPYLLCSSFTTSPTLPFITSTSSRPIIDSLPSHTSTTSETAFIGAVSFPFDNCHNNNRFVDDSEIILPFTRTLPTISSNRSSKGKNGETDKVLKRKKKRTRSRKNIKELESQRMTHIAVERNRRRQMNQHLNDLRSLMPSSYIQRGDQASIVAGAIRLVEELEHVLKSLHLQKQIQGGASNQQVSHSHFDDDQNVSTNKDSYAFLESSMVNVQVEIISLASILVKILAPKGHNQLLHTLQALTFLSLKVIHLSITTLDISILYSIHLKMENDCQIQTASELAKSVQQAFQTPKIWLQ